MRNVYSVSQINAYVRRMFTEDYLLRSVLVRGEVSNCKYHQATGHIYFTLKDASGTLSCVMFAGRRRGLSFPMQNGDQVICAGTVDVYERTGSYQLYANRIIRDGVGALAERFEQLKKKLLEQGMFDPAYKQPIPRYIRRLGIVTASTGAAVRDIIQISRRRNPYIEIILYPAIVQGDAAPDSIVRGIRALDAYGTDVIIIGRGGGSLEDLWAFNEERVAEAVFDCATPVISAVGHETDTVITDFVADLRAPTPSAAAELAVFDLRQFEEDLRALQGGLDSALHKKIQEQRLLARQMERELAHLSPEARIRDQRVTADRAWERLDRLMLKKTEDLRHRITQRERLEVLMREALRAAREKADVSESLAHRMDIALNGSRHRMELLAGSLSRLSPLARLGGGYGYVSGTDGSAICSVRDIQPEDLFRVRLKDGLVEAEARKVTAEESAPPLMPEMQ
ncbi:MAG: exodeoxyribonuclease VII large subunit [Eubacteriales bacterium]|nr:exodeoxyribonuclease VII large subunit [Eubacteriales bacterium]